MKRASSIGTVAVLLAAGLFVAGCAESRMHLSDDYGNAVKQDKLAQIADPDAKYTGVPAPGTNPDRVALAQKRYVNGQVIQPADARISTVGAGAQGGGSGSGSGGGASSSSGPQ